MRRFAPLVVLLLVGACTSPPVLRPESPPEDLPYVVQAGDTLYSISFRRGLDYREVARWNGIDTNYRIEVGQKLVLKAPAGGFPAAPVKPSARVAVELSPSAAPHWAWPTDGAVLASVTQPMGGLGLRLGGTTGATVRAAANGRVVYVGSGLRAYGLLVIVKHDESWLSAYGYNREVLVHEGDAVREGQAIASMGEGPGGSPMLYFEIRLQGKPVDPLKHLPSR